MVNNSLLVAIVATSGTKLGFYFRFSKKKHNFALNKRNNSCLSRFYTNLIHGKAFLKSISLKVKFRYDSLNSNTLWL